MELFSSDTARWIFAAWFTFLGGAVGSFLNVVVYRLPAGMSIAWPGSRCPRCKHPIRSFDNVPVLSWLLLGGRCRDCRRPISGRYPLVEAVTAGLFALLMVAEVFHNGHNLPVRNPNDQPLGYSQVQGMAFCLLHLGLLCSLIASALMTLDGKRPPLRLLIPVAAVGFLAPMVYPWLHPQPFRPGLEHFAWAGVMDSLVDLGIGYYLGRFVRWLGRRLAGVGRAGYQISGEALLLGIVLGWQSAVVLVLAAMALEELTRLAALRWKQFARVTAAVWLPPLALLWILNWAWLAVTFRFR